MNEDDKMEVIEITFKAARRNEITEFKRFTIPLIRRVYPQLVAQRIVKVTQKFGGV